MSGENVKLFVGNLPLDATHEELNKLFAPYGEINTCSLLRQYAFVTLKGEGAADRAMRHLDGKEYRGRPLVVEESRARPPNSTKVFVGNLSATCSADDLHGLFSTFGRVLDCDKVKARLCSNVGYAFVHMERKEDAVTAIEALNGTTFKGRQLAVELSKAQPLINQIVTAGNSANATSGLTTGGREGLLPRPPPSLEHHQSQAAVLAAAAAAAAGLPIQVQQSVHNSFYNTTSFDPTYAALKGITSAKGADGMIYGALASQVYGTVADQVYEDLANHNSGAIPEEAEPQTGPDPTTLFEAARAKFFQEGQKVFYHLSKKSTFFLIYLPMLVIICTLYISLLTRFWQSSRQGERQHLQILSVTAAQSEEIEPPSFLTLFQVPSLRYEPNDVPCCQHHLEDLKTPQLAPYLLKGQILLLGLTQSTTSKCNNTNSITSTSNSTSTFSMLTPILPRLRLRLHRPPHRRRRLPQPLHHQGHTQHLQHMPHQERMHHQEHMTLQEVMMPHQGATTLHVGPTMPRQEATTPRWAMTLLEATEHMIHQELTQQQEATPHPHPRVGGSQTEPLPWTYATRSCSVGWGKQQR
uniref:RNA-binding protein 14 n=1 Tax=Mastacembelus armatus TaxID=205130 RepID=A0A3Q3NGF3_9TELE